MDIKRLQQLAGILKEVESNLSDDEQVIVDDILNTLDEGVFENMIEKIKTYSEQGLITAAILTTLLAAPNFSDAQKSKIKQIAKVKTTANAKVPKDFLEKLVFSGKLKGEIGDDYVEWKNDLLIIRYRKYRTAGIGIDIYITSYLTNDNFKNNYYKLSKFAKSRNKKMLSVGREDPRHWIQLDNTLESYNFLKDFVSRFKLK